MDHEVVPRPCKICDWLLNASRDHFGLHQGEKNVKVTMELEIPKRHILRPTLYTDMVQRAVRWERQKRRSGRKRQRPMAKKCCYNAFLMKLFFGEEKMKTRENKRMVQLFGHMFKNSTHSHFGAWSFHFIHI